MSALNKESSHCDLCRLLCHVLKDKATTPNDLLRFFRVGSTIRVNNQQLPAILSLYALAGKERLYNANIQLGHPKLPDAGDARHVSVLTGWLRNCDRDHECMPLGNQSFLPTRLLDVNFSATSCRLISDTNQLGQNSKYLALSHRWGTHPDPSLATKIVCTYETNIQRLAEGVEDSDFPPLYQDAISVARKLGVRYLWIDSLCIIQAEPGNPNDRDQGRDFLREAGKMELVFSSAYATIATTCAGSPAEHFLKRRPKRQFATIPTERGPYYLAEVIDKFSEDVDRSELNSRGWVFQERALSRRTIYFAEKQTYWECGEGVRCETLTRTENTKSSVLGDANFPFALPDFDKGKRIKLYQTLYERYTRLTFTYPTDRPIAIRGLETRLLRALQTSGGYGVFQLYLCRGLLWQREGPSLTRIDFSKSPARNAYEFVPSWSWMAYDGPIRYMEIPAAAEWAAWKSDVISPWECGGADDGAEPFELRVLVRNVVGFAPGGRVLLDEPNRTSKLDLRCVVVGSKRASDPMQAEVYYSLIVTILDGEEHICQRAGVAFLERRHIDWQSQAVAMRVR
ncbi:hypothetical protein PFICI_12593 [Pestalotiopsis fici W106-1]|uniref:Heterokaryon incompatibility domain-containing protein n=1 Tax=Pestalotiopsis fici (strain W106-1 / CGMCC3.15140) TaxID=1229662 RepID=W3WPB0_PESFW|nr:uncharacterized protein PFICI_12593 [Pestalotiopsis fici W106-1]ETS75649.1 hypothetical protein PFICI_12593 [Pestalotiopsis fici W106-1]